MGKKNNYTQALIKESNKRKIIKALWESSPISRTGLANITNLNKATISNLLPEIIDQNMVTNVGQRKTPVGRSPNLIMFNEKFGLCVGVVIRPRIISTVITDVYGKTLNKKDMEFTDDEDPINVLKNVSNLVKMEINDCSEYSNNLLGIGIGTASLIREPDKMLYAIHSTNNWYNIPIGEVFKKEFNVPIWVDTISNNGLIGEKYFGVAKNIDNVLYLSIGNGIGGGLLINGQLFRGSNGFAGDVGHFVVDPRGKKCHCGNRGCWEVLASCLALPEEETLISVVAEAESGNTSAIAKLNKIGKYIGIGVANLVRVLNPQKVILGGPIVVAGKWVFNPCYTELKTTLWPFVFKRTLIDFAGLGSQSAVIGGAARVIEQLF